MDMNKRIICIVTLIGAGLLVGPLAARTGDDRLLARYSPARYGTFHLDNGDVQSLKGGKKTRAYRVCMEAGEGAVPLKVMYENKDVIVQPGDCRLIEATKIRLASAGKLPAGMTLIGSFNARSHKSYKTDVSMARTASND